MKLLDPEKEEKIITSVIRIVGKQGLTGVNMSYVSKEAGISVGTLYTYFKGKDELLQVAYNRTVKQITYKIYEEFVIDKPIKQSLWDMFYKVLEYRRIHYDETILVDQYMQSRYVKTNRSVYILEFKERNKPIFSLMEKGKEDGIFRKIDSDILINFFNGCVRSYSNAIAQQRFRYDKETEKIYFEMIWKGLTI